MQVFLCFFKFFRLVEKQDSKYSDPKHITYSWNIMCQKWEGDCGSWVLYEIIIKKYAESLKKIVGAVWELPAK